tara:strand:- start:276 stop:659 length:384 start_codon:yes stop_codon:yes gene_type:complete
MIYTVWYEKREIKMGKFLEYVEIPDGSVDKFKALIAKTHGNPEWMEAHAKRTGITSIDAFFVELPTGTAMIVVRDPKESLDNWYASDHPDDKGHFAEAMSIFGMNEEDMAEMDSELKFEHVVAYQSE